MDMIDHDMGLPTLCHRRPEPCFQAAKSTEGALSRAGICWRNKPQKLVVSPLVFLKQDANLRGHVLEDTAEVLHSLARTSFGAGAFPPNFCQEEFFLKNE